MYLENTCPNHILIAKNASFGTTAKLKELQSNNRSKYQYQHRLLVLSPYKVGGVSGTPVRTDITN
jgi:hypothetical protein